MDFTTNPTVSSTPESIYYTTQTSRWVDRYAQIVYGAYVTLTTLNPLTFTQKLLLSNNNAYWLQTRNYQRVVTTTPTEGQIGGLSSDWCSASLHSRNPLAPSTSKQPLNYPFEMKRSPWILRACSDWSPLHPHDPHLFHPNIGHMSPMWHHGSICAILQGTSTASMPTLIELLNTASG